MAYPDCDVSCLIAYSHGGVYDYDFMNFFIRFIDSGDVVLDVGANIGAYTLLFARCASRGRVVAFEPAPTAFARLSENVGRNRLEARVRLVNKAVGDEAGSLRFSIGDKSSTHHVAVDRDNPPEKTMEVLCTTLSDEATLQSIDRCDFIKIDVEGYEECVIVGGQAFIQRTSPKAILFEANGRSLDYGSTLEHAFEILGALGYRIGFYIHGRNTIRLITGTVPAISPEGNYLAFSRHFLEQIGDSCSVLNGIY